MAEANPTTAQSTSFAVRVTALKNGLFQSLSVMQKRAHSNAVLSVVGAVIKFLQLMAFLFISAEFKWDKDVIQPIRVLSLVPSPAGWFKVLSPTFLIVLFFICFVWVTLFCSLMVFTVRNFLRGQIPSLAPLRVLASIGQFSATVAYIPLLTLLLSVYMCDNVQPGMTDAWAGYRCMVDGHLALVVLSTIFATVFACLAALFSLVFFDNHPLSSNMAAKVHGRSEFIMLLVKTILILTIEIFAPQINNVWVLVALNIAAACTWISLTLYYMPFIHFSNNAFICSLGCVYLWSGICLAMGMAGPWINSATLLYVGSPFAAVVGVWLAQLRRKWVLETAAAKLRNVYEVDMKARFLLHKALDTLLEQAAQASNRRDSADFGNIDDSASLIGGAMSPSGNQTGKSGFARRGEEHRQDRAAHFDSAQSPRSVVDGAKGKRGRDGRRPSGAEETDADIFAASYMACDAESRERMVRDKLPMRVLSEVEALYKNAATRFPHSAILHMFGSRFYSVFKNDRHLATSHLLLANRLSPALDVAFLSFQARRAAETASGSGVLSSAMHRVSFDKHLADARLHTMRAARAQVSFWQELCDSTPDINMLHSISSDLTLHTSLAEKHFKEVFLLHPQSLAAMRLFAQYNMSVANNPENAAAISAEADRIEDQKNKEQSAQRAGASTDGFPFLEEVSLENMADAVAQVIVGASSRDLGIILSANSAACKIFGYTRLQLERRNVSVIIPSPFTESHDGYMRRYMSTGEGLFIETSRQILGLHRLGHLVPVTICLRETALSDGTPTFMATLRPLNFSSHIVMMNEDWVIEGGTAGALMALQVDAATLSASDVCMADYCPLLDNSAEVSELMGMLHGDVVQMRLPGYANKDSAFASSRDVSSPRSSRGKGVAPGGGAALWSQEALEVKACLASQVVKGHTVNILTFRLLSSNEKAQRSNALASRRASLVAQEGAATASTSARPSFQRLVKELQAEVKTGSLPYPDPLHRIASGSTDRRSSTNVSDGTASGSPSSDTVTAMEPHVPEGHPEITAASFTGATCPVVGVTSTSKRPATPLLTLQSKGRGGKERRVSIVRITTPTQAGSSSSPSGGGRISTPTRPSSSRPRKATPPPVRFSSQASDGDVQVSIGYESDARANEDEGDDIHGRPRSPHVNGLGSAHKGEGVPQFQLSDERADSSDGGELDGAGTDRAGTDRGGFLSDDDGKGSVKSGGSSSKRSAIGRGTVNKLRRILSESIGSASAASKTFSGLNALYVAGWLMIVLNIALGSLSAALLSSSFTVFQRNLRFSAIASEVSQAAIHSMIGLTFRNAHKAGWWPASNATELEMTRDLRETADLMASLVREMYQLVQGTSSEHVFTSPELLYATYDTAVVEPPGKISDGLLRELILDNVTAPWTRSDGSVLVGSQRQTSFIQFIAEWSAKLKTYSNVPIAQVTRDDVNAIWLLSNTQSGAPAAEYIEETVYAAYLASLESRAAVETLVFWIFIAMGPCVCFLLLVVLVPIFAFVDRKRDDVMEVFLDVPMLMTMHLRSGAETRLRMLRADEDGVDEGDEEDDEEEARRALAMGGGEEAGAQVDMEDGTVDWEAVIAMITVEASRAEKRRAKLKGILSGGEVALAMSGSATAYSSPTSPRKPGGTGCCSCARNPEQKAAPPAHAAGRPTRSLCSRGTRAPGGGYYRSVVNADGSVSTFTRREFVKTWTSVLSLAGFLVPIVFMFAFYLVLYLVTNDTLTKVMAMASFNSLSTIRLEHLKTARNQLLFTIAMPASQPELAFRTEWETKQIMSFEYVSKLLAFDLRIAPSPEDNFLEPDREYTKGAGSELSAIAGIEPATMRRILDWHTKDACVLLAQSNPTFNLARCRAYNRGVLTSGLQAGLDDYIVRCRRVRDRRWRARVPANTTTGTGVMVYTTRSEWAREWEGRQVAGGTGVPGVDVLPPGGIYSTDTAAEDGGSGQETVGDLVPGSTIVTPWSVAGELFGEDFQTVFTMCQDYLLPALVEITSYYTAAGSSVVSTYRLFLTAFVGGFLACFVVGTLAIFLPALRALGLDVQSKRALLLLLPAPVIAHVPSLRVMVLNIVEEHEGAAGSARSSSGQHKAGMPSGGHSQDRGEGSE